jgi:hypothetical protein
VFQDNILAWGQVWEPSFSRNEFPWHVWDHINRWGRNNWRVRRKWKLDCARWTPEDAKKCVGFPMSLKKCKGEQTNTSEREKKMLFIMKKQNEI